MPRGMDDKAPAAAPTTRGGTARQVHDRLRGQDVRGEGRVDRRRLDRYAKGRGDAGSEVISRRSGEEVRFARGAGCARERKGGGIEETGG